jgi:hypothetical protein
MTRTYIFGDSFIGVFNLLDSKKVYRKKFKAKSMYGLSKPDDPDAKIIIDIIKNNVNDVANIILWFGNVDVTHVYFWQVVNYKIKSFKKFASKIIESYGKFIDSIKRICDKPIYINGIVYPLVNDSNFINSITNYGVLQKDIASKIPFELSSYAKRKTNVRNFNKLLFKMCHEHNLIYVDINKQISDSNYNILDKFKSCSLLNIHICWEPTIKLWIKKYNKYGMTNLTVNDIQPENKLNESLEKYHQEKMKKISKLKKLDNINNGSKT